MHLHFTFIIYAYFCKKQINYLKLKFNVNSKKKKENTKISQRKRTYLKITVQKNIS